MELQWLASRECNNFWLLCLQRVIGDYCVSVACCHVRLVVLCFPFSGLCVCGWCVCGWVGVLGGGCGGLWVVSKVESSLCASFLSRFILLVSFSDTLLNGFHFEHGLWLPFVTAFAVKGILIVPVGNMGPFEPGDNTFQTFFWESSASMRLAVQGSS